jgi:hypothetical protein
MLVWHDFADRLPFVPADNLRRDGLNLREIETKNGALRITNAEASTHEATQKAIRA